MVREDLLAHLAYWDRAAAEQVREFEAGKWRAKKRTRARGTGGKFSARTHRLLSVRAAQGASPGTTPRLDRPSWQSSVNEKESSGSTQLDGADAGPRSSNRVPYNSLVAPLGECHLFGSRSFPNMDFSSSPFKRNFIHSQFH